MRGFIDGAGFRVSVMNEPEIEVRGAHPSKTAKGEAASVMMVAAKCKGWPAPSGVEKSIGGRDALRLWR